MPKPPADRVLHAGVGLHLLDWGGDGPPLLFLHGGGLEAHAWDPVCAALRDDFRCLALDQRGHGASDWAPPYTMAGHAADIARVIETLGLDAPVVVGHSMGGMNALAAAILHAPPRALVIVDTAPLRADTAKADALLAAGQARRPPGATYDPEHMDGDTIRSQRAEATALGPRLGEVRCPVLVVHGAVSRIITRADAEDFVASLPDAELVVIDGAGHNVQRDRPFELADAIRAFLSRGTARCSPSPRECASSPPDRAPRSAPSRP